MLISILGVFCFTVVTSVPPKQSELFAKKFNLSHKVTEPYMLNIYQLCFPKFISYG
jgi:hypothetical protein